MSVLERLGDIELPAAIREAVEADRIPAVIADASRVLESTTPYLDLVGFSREELERGELSWMRLTPPDSLVNGARAFGEARATGRAKPYRKSYLRRDGTEVRIVAALLLVRTDPLQVFGVVAAEGDAEAVALAEALVA